MLKEAKENCEKGIVSQETLETQTKFKQKVFTEGTYKIGTDILPGEYVFIKNEDAETIQVKFGLDYFRYLSGNIDTLKILPTLNVDDDNNEFTLKGGTMYHIDNSPQLAINGPGVYKVGKTIPAGQYEVKKSHYISGPYYLASENNYELFNVYSDYKSNNIYHLNYEGYDRKNKESHYASENGEIITLIQGQYLIILEDTIKFYKK